MDIEELDLSILNYLFHISVCLFPFTNCCIEFMLLRKLYDDLSRLNDLMDICANYGFENDLLFNRSKSMCMVVKPRGRNVSTPLMFLNGNALEYVDSVKYLGVMFSQDMKDDADMSRHLHSFYACSNVIFSKFHHCSAPIKVNLIKT